MAQAISYLANPLVLQAASIRMAELSGDKVAYEYLLSKVRTKDLHTLNGILDAMEDYPEEYSTILR